MIQPSYHKITPRNFLQFLRATGVGLLTTEMLHILNSTSHPAQAVSTPGAKGFILPFLAVTEL